VILGRILEYLEARECASIGEIARALDSSPDAVRSMLHTLERKNRVHRWQTPTGCGSSCHQCHQGGIELFAAGPPPAAPFEPPACGLRDRRR
jgi:predicted ArsR family transcriptional regulator